VGSLRLKGREFFSEGETFEGPIPRALPVRNKTGAGFEGVNRQEGNQTLKAERGGRASLRQADLEFFQVL
jgi:hypothetical protein